VRRKPKAKYWKATGDHRERHRLEALCGWPSLDWREFPVPSEHQQFVSRALDYPGPVPGVR